MKTQRKLRILIAVTLAAITIPAYGDWQADYQRALKAAGENDWATARESFQSAAKDRAQDSQESTRLPGPVSEPRIWRSGSAYSPNFGAAYAAYRLGKEATESDAKQQYLMLAAAELKTLIEGGQASPDAIKVLGTTYTLLGDKSSASELKAMATNFKVDTSFVDPYDQAAPVASSSGGSNNSTTTTNGGATVTTGQNGGRIINVKAGHHTDLSAVFGSEPVATIDTKFALIIGNTKSPEPGTEIAFAANDAALVNAALTSYAGYAQENVTVLTDATAAQIKAAVTALAERTPAKATILIYFTGQASHLGGQDYLAGNDIEFSTDSSKMIEKRAVIQPFLSKGANVFFFAQCNRPFTGSDYFGRERLQQGTLSETYATIPGSIVTSVYRETGQVGLYTDAFARTLQEFYTNQIPITEFCWNVFYAMRGGTGSNSQRGGSTQTPSLPILTNLGPTSPF
jgi:hypothetical protein